MLWSHPKKHLIITIENHRLVYLVAKKKKSGVQVITFGTLELQEEIIRSGMIIDPDQLVRRLESLRKEYRVKDITFGLPGYLPHRGILPVVPAEEGRLEELVQGYLAMQAQFRSRDRVVEYEIVPGEVKVVTILAIGQDIIDAYIQVAKRAGYRRVNIEYVDDVVATSRVDEGARLVLHVAGHESLLLVVSGKVVLQHERVPVGVHDIVQAVLREQGGTQDEALQVIKEPGMHKLDLATRKRIFDALEPLAYQVRRILGQWHQPGYKHHLERHKLSHLEMYGAGSHLVGWREFFEETCRCRVQVLDERHHDRVMATFLRAELPVYLPAFLLAERVLQ